MGEHSRIAKDRGVVEVRKVSHCGLLLVRFVARLEEVIYVQVRKSRIDYVTYMQALFIAILEYRSHPEATYVSSTGSRSLSRIAISKPGRLTKKQ